MFETPEDGSFLVDLADGVLRLTFNRPEFGNATSSAVVPLLTRLFAKAKETRAVRCIVVEGKGKIFSAGGDVVGFGRALEQETAARQADFAGRLANLSDLVQAVLAFDRPLVAVVRGAAAGAALLYVLAADYVIGDDTACFVFAHQRVGLPPDGGVSGLLPRVVGERAARRLLLTAAKLDAAEAERLGILDRIVPADELAAEAGKIVRRFAQAPQWAITSAKRLVAGAADRSMAEQLAAERDAIVTAVGDPDFAEGVRAFLEKRSARFPSARD